MKLFFLFSALFFATIFVHSIYFQYKRVFENFTDQIGISYIWDSNQNKMKELSAETNGVFGPLTISDFVFYQPESKLIARRSFVPNYLDSICFSRRKRGFP